MKVLLFTRSLDAGGAERQLVLLARNLHAQGTEVAVAVFYGNGLFRHDLISSGIKLIDLNKSGRWDVLGFLWRTVKCIRSYNPDAIYTFIGTSVVATILRPLFPKAALIWGVRSSNIDQSHYDWLSQLMDKIAIILSRFADAIICNSKSGRAHIIHQGYKNDYVYFVPNGISTQYFVTNQKLGLDRRIQWALPKDAFIFGLVARIDPVKGHNIFLKADAIIYINNPHARFVCIGEGDKSLLNELKVYAENLGVADQVIWAGLSQNTVMDYSAINVLVSSSQSEGFPNVLVEAMSCGLPVVATDVGDCREIVGDCGWIVPPNDPEALAKAMLKAMDAVATWPSERSRKRVMEKFSVEAMVNQTLTVLESVVRK